MNYIDYLYKQEEIEGDSDEENEDFSRDNIDEYKTKEQQYDERGVKLQQFNNYYQKNNENIEFEDDDDEGDEGEESDEDNEGNDDQDNNDEGNDDNSDEGNEYSNDG
jgi:hypothetical protein